MLSIFTASTGPSRETRSPVKGDRSGPGGLGAGAGVATGLGGATAAGRGVTGPGALTSRKAPAPAMTANAAQPAQITVVRRLHFMTPPSDAGAGGQTSDSHPESRHVRSLAQVGPPKG